MKNLKRTKQTTDIITYVNEYLKKNHITDIYDPVFTVMTNALLHNRLYEGFHLYKADGTLSNGVNPDYIQIF